MRDCNKDTEVLNCADWLLMRVTALETIVSAIFNAEILLFAVPNTVNPAAVKPKDVKFSDPLALNALTENKLLDT